MSTLSQKTKLQRKCTATLIHAMNQFPKILANCESDAAASIIAGLIKVQMVQPEAQMDPQEALNEIIRRIDDGDDTPSPPPTFAF